VRDTILILLITLLLGEALTRWALGIEPLALESIIWEDHPRWGWAHRPHAEETFAKLGCRQRIRSNARGLREREIPHERTPGLLRILAVGDSGLVGFEVAAEDVFTRVAERALLDAGHRVEFVNAGCRGYGTDQALLFLEDEGLAYRPDVVLYWFGPNDPDDNRTVHRPYRRFGKGYFDLDADGELVLHGTPVPQFPYRRGLLVDEHGALQPLELSAASHARLWARDNLICRSSVLTAAAYVAAALPSLAGRLRGAGSVRLEEPGGPERGSRLFRVTAAMVARMRTLAEEQGAQFFMIGARMPWTVALREELTLIDLGDWQRFRARLPPNAKIHVPYDTHWNELGHRVYGEALAAALIESRALADLRDGAAVSESRDSAASDLRRSPAGRRASGSGPGSSSG